MPEEPTKTYALATGVSQGLGQCFALDLSKRGINTILAGFANRINWFFMTILPIWIRLPIIGRSVCNELEHKSAMK